MKQFLIIFFALISLFSFSQELELDEGIYFEKPIYTDTSAHRYSMDNISYKIGYTYIYDYYYVGKDGLKKKFINNLELSHSNPLQLTPYENPCDSAIDKIKLEVNDYRRSFEKQDSSYNQTVISYFYLNKQGQVQDSLLAYLLRNNLYGPKYPAGHMTGVVDNKKNLWLHPPRDYTFKILQFSPFPFYVLDPSVKQWGWNMNVGGSWLDSRWIDYSELIKISFNYERTTDEELVTPMGKIKCKVTNGTGSFEYADKKVKTHLKSYYNSYYGFVKLDYININGSKIVIELVNAKYNYIPH